MTEILIRPAAADDAELLTELSYTPFVDAFGGHPKNAPDDLADYMGRAFSLEQIRKELDDPRSIFLIAEVDSETAGYAKLLLENTEPDIMGEEPVELARLYAHQKFLGQGVGQALMDACFEKAKKAGCDSMWLGVWEYNPRAKRFYEKNGFTEVGSHTFQLGSDPQTDLLMQKWL